jgi:hypothetical protein
MQDNALIVSVFPIGVGNLQYRHNFTSQMAHPVIAWSSARELEHNTFSNYHYTRREGATPRCPRRTVPQLCSSYVPHLAHTFAPHYSLNTLTSTRSVPVISENATTFYSPTNTLPPYILQCSQISPHAHPPDKPPPNMPILSTHPFKALYGLFFLTKVPILLPWALIRYAPKSFRPTPNTPLRICVVNAICRELFKY